MLIILMSFRKTSKDMSQFFHGPIDWDDFHKETLSYIFSNQIKYLRF